MSQYVFQELNEGEIFDPLQISPATPFTQAAFYGDWQKGLGRQVKRFVVKKGSETVAYFQIIRYPLFRGKNYFYVPYGPVTKDTSGAFLSELKEELVKITAGENAVFARLDFTPSIPAETLSQFFTKSKLSTYHSAYFQPRTEWFLPLERSEDEILMAMHEKTRYSVRLAERKEIKTEIISGGFEKYFERFYELMSETAKRDGFSLHPRKYYEAIFESLPNIKDAYLSLAKFGEKILAMNLIIPYGKTANFVFGGLVNDERNRMPSHAAHFAGIRHAKSLGLGFYNFGAVVGNKTDKSWQGLSDFKKKFGGQEMKHSEFHDVVVNPFWYHLYNFRKWLKR